MNKYSNGKIYAIRHPRTELYYIGSTCQNYLSARLAQHKAIQKGSSKKLFDLGINECYIELLELFPCNTRLELEKREGELIRQFKNNLVNRSIPQRSKKECNAEYRLNNKNKIKEAAILYRTINKDKIIEYKAIMKEDRYKKVNCQCGKTYSKNHKARHEQSIRHLKTLNITQ